MFLAYLGPETLLPVSSVIAAVIGTILMGGQYLVRIVKNSVRAVFGRAERGIPDASTSNSHSPRGSGSRADAPHDESHPRPLATSAIPAPEPWPR